MSEIRELNAEVLKTLPLPPTEEETDKDARGRVLFIGGSALSPGAALLCGIAALRGGAGKVVVATAKPIADRIGLRAPEFGVVALESTRAGEPDGKDDSLDLQLTECDAVLLGPGMMDANNARALGIRVLSKIKVPLVLDAAAIAAWSGHFNRLRQFDAPRILTPHAGEMAKLMGVSKQTVLNSPVEIARRASQELASTVILKGATTYIANPDSRTWRHAGGVCGLATAGSGDTLAGLLTALLARGASPECACAWSVLVHAKAGAILSKSVGPIGFLASELPGSFPRILQNLASQKRRR
jgi:ADP-dependent NAD(P)H-hydrate dehydratase